MNQDISRNPQVQAAFENILNSPAPVQRPLRFTPAGLQAADERSVDGLSDAMKCVDSLDPEDTLSLYDLRRIGFSVDDVVQVVDGAVQGADALLRHIAAEASGGVLPLFEAARPGDARVRQAIEAARQVAQGERSADDLDELCTAAYDAGEEVRRSNVPAALAAQAAWGATVTDGGAVAAAREAVSAAEHALRQDTGEDARERVQAALWAVLERYDGKAAR